MESYTVPSTKICLFFTYGISLKKWDELGIIDREIILYNNLVKRGAEVAFFTYGDEDDLSYASRIPGIKIIPAYMSCRNYKNKKLNFLHSFLLPLKFRKVLTQFDILKTNQMWGSWVPLIAKWLLGKRLILRCGYEHYYTLLSDKCGCVKRSIFYLFSWIMYFYSDRIVLTTDLIAEFVSKTFLVPEKKISLQPNFIDTELFAAKNGTVLQEKRLLFVGRLSREKNLFALIEACKKINTGVDLIGDGILKPELQEFANRIKADVRFLGIIPNKELPAYIVRYDIFILPSFYEGNPKTLLEAMSCAMPVIGTNVDGIRELINNNENGILCGVTAEEIAGAIIRLADDPGLKQKLGQNARKYIVNNCSINRIVDTELKIYQYTLKK